MNLEQFIRQIKESTPIYRSDFFNVSNSLNWKEFHPLGPVHFQFQCKLCGEIVLTDSRECDFTDPIWAKISLHLEKHA
jgi:hypothetical protein